jgi:hypothetical protein
VPYVLKSGSLNLLEPPGPVQACNGFDFLLIITKHISDAESEIMNVTAYTGVWYMHNQSSNEWSFQLCNFLIYLIL